MRYLKPATLSSIYETLLRARKQDVRELFATEYKQDHFSLAQRIAAIPGPSYTAYVGPRPVACVGAAGMHPGVYSVWAFGTEDFRQVAGLLTKHVKRVMIPALKDIGAHRAECRVMADNVDAWKWLERLGAKREAVLAGFGSRREDFYLYAWTHDPTVRTEIPEADKIVA